MPATSIFDLRKAQITLIGVWLFGVAPSVLLLLVRTFGPNALGIERVWGWWLSSSIPTISLIIGAYVATPETDQHKPADRSFFKVAVSLSVFYLMVLTAAIVLYPTAEGTALTILSNVSLVLAPLQGLVAAGLSMFFVRKAPH